MKAIFFYSRCLKKSKNNSLAISGETQDNAYSWGFAGYYDFCSEIQPLKKRCSNQEFLLSHIFIVLCADFTTEVFLVEFDECALIKKTTALIALN